MENTKCTCSITEKMVIACSGAADVGYIADQVARKLSRNKQRKMTCMALFASCNEDKLRELKQKDILVIDGCEENCGKKVMEQCGIEGYSWIRITDLGFEKGKTPASQQTVVQVYDRIL